MNKPDDLEQLWKTQSVDTAMQGEEMRKIVLKRVTAFDRSIRLRNRLETIAALVVVVFFVGAMWVQRNGLQRLGSAIVVAGALWIVHYLRRHGMDATDPAPDQTAASYRRALAQKYEHQIRLLRNAKFWYLLPMYLGLLVGSAGILKEHTEQGKLSSADVILPLFYTIFFAGVWWLNEVYSVRKLQRWRMHLLSGMEDESQC